MSKSFRIQSNIASAIVGVGSRKAGNTGGALPRFRVHDVFAGITVSDIDYYVTAVAASNEAAGVDLTLLKTAPDFPRNVTITSDGAQTAVVTVTGTDQFGAAQTEEITFNGAATVAGVKIFATVSKIHQAQRSAASNISVGTGALVGTSRRVIGCGLDSGVFTTASGESTMVQETTRPVRAVTASVHGVTFATTLDTTKTWELAYWTDEAR